MYKDKDRQREAVRQAVRRHRAKGITVIPKNVIPCKVLPCDTLIPEVIPVEHEPEWAGELTKERQLGRTGLR